LSRGEGRREFFFSCIFTYSFSILLLKLTIYFITQLVLASAKTSWENALKSTQSQIFLIKIPQSLINPYFTKTAALPTQFWRNIPDFRPKLSPNSILGNFF
jgi:hypothetical protein